MSLSILSVFIIALPIASIAWTITHEEVVREFRDICLAKSTTSRRVYDRKFFHLFTCEYCLSHYVTGWCGEWQDVAAGVQGNGDCRADVLPVAQGVWRV